MKYPRTLSHFLACSDSSAGDKLRTTLENLGAESLMQVVPSAFTFSLEGEHSAADLLDRLRASSVGSRLAVIAFPVAKHDSAAYPPNEDALGIFRDSIPESVLTGLLPK